MASKTHSEVYKAKNQWWDQLKKIVTKRKKEPGDLLKKDGESPIIQ